MFYDFKNVLAGMTKFLPGLMVVAAVTVVSVMLQATTFFSKTLPLSTLLIAILIGMSIRNSIDLPECTQKGITFSSKKVLRLAVIFLGFKLSISQVIALGPASIITILIVSTTTLLFTVWLGKRMGISPNCALLLGSGVSICGASAIAAVDAVVKSREEETAFAIGAITLFGTFFMFLYPCLYGFLHLPDMFYALWAGTSIHEVAQVAAAGAVTEESFKAMATTVKMIRVLFIIPVTLILTFAWFNHDRERDRKFAASVPKRRINIPWFALLFFVMVLVNSYAGLPQNVTAGLITFDNWIMTAAMAGLGLDISLKAMAQLDRRAVILGTVSSIFISVFSAVVIGILMTIHLG